MYSLIAADKFKDDMKIKFKNIMQALKLRETIQLSSSKKIKYLY